MTTEETGIPILIIPDAQEVARERLEIELAQQPRPTVDERQMLLSLFAPYEVTATEQREWLARSFDRAVEVQDA